MEKILTRIKCLCCMIPIPDPGESPDPETLLCDRCLDGLQNEFNNKEDA